MHHRAMHVLLLFSLSSLLFLLLLLLLYTSHPRYNVTGARRSGCCYVTDNDTTRPWNKSCCFLVFVVCLFCVAVHAKIMANKSRDGGGVDGGGDDGGGGGGGGGVVVFVAPRAAALNRLLKYTNGGCCCQPLFLLSLEGSHLFPSLGSIYPPTPNTTPLLFDFECVSTTDTAWMFTCWNIALDSYRYMIW